MEKSFVSVRINNKHLELLNALADIDNITLADEIRTAIEYYISSRKSEPDINAKISETKKRRDLRLRKLLNYSS